MNSKRSPFYDADYFERGVESGKSNYDGYVWSKRKYLRQLSYFLSLIRGRQYKKILDFGCAKGFLVKTLLEAGFDAYGCDISTYAITACDPEVADRCFLFSGSLMDLPLHPLECIVSFHVFEHLEKVEVANVLAQASRVGLPVVFGVPVGDGVAYNNPFHEGDISHIHKQPAIWWSELVENAGWHIVHEKRLRIYRNQTDLWGALITPH